MDSAVNYCIYGYVQGITFTDIKEHCQLFDHLDKEFKSPCKIVLCHCQMESIYQIDNNLQINGCLV